MRRPSDPEGGGHTRIVSILPARTLLHHVTPCISFLYCSPIILPRFLS